MNTKLSVSAALFSILTAPIAHAQGLGIAGEFNYAEVGERSGFEIGVGFHATDGPWRFSPIIGALIYQGELDGFRSEAGGICRDLSNGQFSNSENCDATETEAYGKLEASYLADGLEVGLGYRFAEDTEGAYGLVGYRFSSNSSLQAVGGEDYLAVGITFRQ